MIKLTVTSEVDTTLSDTEFMINGEKYDLNETVQKYKTYLTEFDSHVCLICIPYHGRKYLIGDPEAPMVPQHPECRCEYDYSKEQLKDQEPTFSKFPVNMGKSIFGLKRWDLIVKYNLSKNDLFHNGSLILLQTLLKKYTL